MPLATTPTLVLLYCPCPTVESARELSEKLLHARLVACANLLSPMESHYWWEGVLTQETETPLLLKTTQEHADAAEALLAQHHPYETPCILRWETAANAKYIKWAKKSTKTIASEANMQ